jgi:hypothetical protein
MPSIGVNLHQDPMTVVVLDEKREVVDKTSISTKCRNKMVAYFSSYSLQDQVAVERVGFYYWFWELVRPQVNKRFLAAPAGVRAFAGRKAKTAAMTLCCWSDFSMMAAGPPAYVPEEPVRLLRELVRCRHAMARTLAAAKKSLRWGFLNSHCFLDHANLPVLQFFYGFSFDKLKDIKGILGNRINITF